MVKSPADLVEVELTVFGQLIDDVAITEVPLGFFSGAAGAQKMSVLGCEVLKRFNVIFDLVNNDLYLELIRR